MDSQIEHKLEMYNMIFELLTKDTSPDKSKFKQALKNQLLIARAELIEYLLKLDSDNPNFIAITDTLNSMRPPL
jgi:hypothetical protein